MNDRRTSPRGTVRRSSRSAQRGHQQRQKCNYSEFARVLQATRSAGGRQWTDNERRDNSEAVI